MSDSSSGGGNLDALLKGGPDQVPSELPILTLENFVLFPFMIAPIMIAGEERLRLIDEALRGPRVIGVFTRQAPEGDSTAEKSGGEKPKGGPPALDELPPVGCAAAILKLLRIPDGSARLLVHGVSRVRITGAISDTPFPRAKVEGLAEEEPTDFESAALVKNAQGLLQQLVTLSSLPEDLAVAANNIQAPGKLADLVASNFSMPVAEQQKILEIIDAKKRLEAILEILTREAQVLELGSRIQDEVRTKMDRSQREYILREQMKAIKRELGEDDGANPEIEELRASIAKAELPEHAHAAAEKELSRLEMMTPASAEYGVSHNYLDWILSLPWNTRTRDHIDIRRAKKILDEDHYDLDKVKERILEYLAVIKLRKALRGPILCFAGPPGVGKTSLGKSIARALGRKFFRISLGGMRDEAEIRGHRRTYIGAMPGRIIAGLKTCGANNPVVMLDEIDKLGADFRGDPASALLETLDPEQNNSFTDHYLDLAFDLSNVMFITTANLLDTIPGPLLDRMDVLTLSGYTFKEKVEIAKRYLIPRAYQDTGVSEKNLVFEDSAIERIIGDYTREAGLRNLERELVSVCRKVARSVAGGKAGKKRVARASVPKYLGPSKFYSETAGRPLQPGVMIGLAWTAAGGEILFIEASMSEAPGGTGKLQLTGQLGDVMRESAQAAYSYLQANAASLGIDSEKFGAANVHIHIPAGATPKDGPSAGVALCCALASLMSGKVARPQVAMTGEMTLTGLVLPVGGVKEKALAAHRAGIREIYLPKHNTKDLEEIPAEVRQQLRFIPVKKIGEVLNTIFQSPAANKAKRSKKKAAKPARKRAKRAASIRK